MRAAALTLAGFALGALAFSLTGSGGARSVAQGAWGEVLPALALAFYPACVAARSHAARGASAGLALGSAIGVLGPGSFLAVACLLASIGVTIGRAVAARRQKKPGPALDGSWFAAALIAFVLVLDGAAATWMAEGNNAVLEHWTVVPSPFLVVSTLAFALALLDLDKNGLRAAATLLIGTVLLAWAPNGGVVSTLHGCFRLSGPNQWLVYPPAWGVIALVLVLAVELTKRLRPAFSGDDDDQTLDDVASGPE